MIRSPLLVTVRLLKVLVYLVQQCTKELAVAGDEYCRWLDESAFPPHLPSQFQWRYRLTPVRSLLQVSTVGSPTLSSMPFRTA